MSQTHQKSPVLMEDSAYVCSVTPDLSDYVWDTLALTYKNHVLFGGSTDLQDLCRTFLARPALDPSTAGNQMMTHSHLKQDVLPFKASELVEGNSCYKHNFNLIIHFQF